MKDISDFYPVVKGTGEIPLEVPAFLKGDFKDAVMPAYQELVKDNFSFKFNGDEGSNPFIVGALNYVLKNSKFRMPVPTDNIFETIFPLIKNEFCTGLNAFDVREKKPDYKKDYNIWKQLNELAERKQGRANHPFRVQGVYCVPDETEEEDGVIIAPAKNFRVIEDKRLNLPSGERFNSLDELGMIKPEKNGKYTWCGGYSHDIMLGVYLTSRGALLSNHRYLTFFDDHSRVVIVNAEGAVVPKFSIEEYNTKVQDAYEKKVALAEDIKSKALEDLAKL